MNDIIDFLQRLAANNERTWFLEHKAEYEALRLRFEQFTARLIARIAEFDPSVADLTPKDCTYRIYRDVRFSKDKSPYKTHIGCYICRGGKKSGYSGYYFHLQPDFAERAGADIYTSGNLLAIGDYMCEPQVLRVLREDIENGEGDFPALVQQAAAHGMHLDDTFRLKRMPKGFSEESAVADLLKYKVYCLVSRLPQDLGSEDALLDRLVEMCRAAHPFLDFVNRAITYVREENL
jgi:uncharacterized protein (TIGR02453 family)